MTKETKLSILKSLFEGTKIDLAVQGTLDAAVQRNTDDEMSDHEVQAMHLVNTLMDISDGVGLQISRVNEGEDPSKLMVNLVNLFVASSKLLIILDYPLETLFSPLSETSTVGGNNESNFAH